MKIYTTGDVKKLLARADSAAFHALLKAYGVPSVQTHEAAAILERDIAYDPNPYISTMDYRPEDRLAAEVHPLWTDALTRELADRCADVLGTKHAEDFFRWNRSEVCRRIFEAAGICGITLPAEPVLPSFYCPYAFSRLYGAGYTDAGSGVLLRRTNCRPWGFKPVGCPPA